MTPNKKAELRMKKILLDDKLRLPNGFSALLSSDLKKIAKSYFEYDDKNFVLKIDIDAKGRYEVSLKLCAERVLPLEILSLPDTQDTAR